MTGWRRLVVLGLAVIATACGAAQSSMQARSQPAATEAVPPTPSSPRAAIDQLDQLIRSDLATLELDPPLAAACVSASCMTAEATNTSPPLEDPECRPAASEVCTDTCKLATSICANAGKICQIANDLGDTDLYANDKCISGKASCDAAKKKCCACQL
ncbi:MAG: hypothetical protein AB7O24_31280 [Kofleriaceae bacterium]